MTLNNSLVYLNEVSARDAVIDMIAIEGGVQKAKEFEKHIF